MKVPLSRHRLLSSLLALLAVVLLLETWERTVAYRDYSVAAELRDGWRADRETPHDRELNEAFKFAYRAAELDPANADFRFMIASLHSWRERGLRLWPDQAMAQTRKTIENLKAALALRPTWFEGWIALALVKYQSRGNDQELVVALEKAIQTGQFETAVHHGMAIIGLRTWDGLGDELRGRVEETIRIGLTNPDVDEFVVEQIVMTGKVDLFRKTLESDDNLDRLLNKYIARREKSL